MKELIDKLRETNFLHREEFITLFQDAGAEVREYAAGLARQVAQENYGDRVFIRGLVEFTNHCRNNCLYCGIRRSNPNASRYRLDKDEILECCRQGHDLGFRTFVLQGGEDEWYDIGRMTDIVAAMRAAHPDSAITLSIGEKTRDEYLALFQAGADRYLLRHETASPEHYALLHPRNLNIANRIRCLWDLKSIGFQTGCGFMVGSPHQTPEYLSDDMAFLRWLEPEMVGIGPFVPHHDTPFAPYRAGDVGLTLFLLSLVRLMLPRALIPATTALGTVDEQGREKGVLSGANVLMPNLSPPSVRNKYLLYDNKLNTGEEAAEYVEGLRRKMAAIGYRVVVDRGDYQGCIDPSPPT